MLYLVSNHSQFKQRSNTTFGAVKVKRNIPIILQARCTDAIKGALDSEKITPLLKEYNFLFRYRRFDGHNKGMSVYAAEKGMKPNLFNWIFRNEQVGSSDLQGGFVHSDNAIVEGMISAVSDIYQKMADLKASKEIKEKFAKY